MTRTCLTCGRNFDAESAVTICGRCEYEGDCKQTAAREPLDRLEQRERECEASCRRGRVRRGVYA